MEIERERNQSSGFAYTSTHPDVSTIASAWVIPDRASAALIHSLAMPYSYLDEPRHIFSGLRAGEKSFVRHIPTLLNELPSAIGVKEELLDSNVESLDTIETAVGSLNPAVYHSDPVFSPLVAYIGALICNNTGGRIVMRLAEDHRTWEPLIELPNMGLRSEILLQLHMDLDDLFDDETGTVIWRPNIRGTVRGFLRGFHSYSQRSVGG